MGIVGGFDVHRAQITYDLLDTETGEVRVGRIMPTTRLQLREWLVGLQGEEVAVATEGCTGWRFVVEELHRAGVEAHLAEPADTATLRGRKKRAKTDRADARLLRTLLAQGRLPESWIPPSHVLETRIKGRLYMALVEERRTWSQRIRAQLFHQGVEKRQGVLTSEGRVWLEEVDLSAGGRLLVEVALRIAEALEAEIKPLRAELAAFARHQPGCRALVKEIFGIGELLSPIVWSEMGDTRRFSASRQAVRHTGLDITVWDSDGRRPPGFLSRQGPSALRWALYEAAQSAARRTSPHHGYYLEVKERLGAKRAALSVARKLAREVHHVLRELGDTAWEEVG